MATLYHVTPHDTWMKSIRTQGLVPGVEKRGRYADSREPRIYLFVDEAPAEDGLQNWLIEEFPEVRWFALLRVDVPQEWVRDDPEIAGSFYVTQPVPAASIRLVRKFDGGEEE